MKKELQTTIWLDLLTYVIIPFVLLIGTIDIIRALLYGVFNLEFFVFLLIEVVFLMFYAYTFYNSYKRTKDAYVLFRILIFITAIRAGLDYANTQNINNGDSFILAFLGYFAIVAIVWIYPNEIYFKKRKDIFSNKSTLKFTKRCENCKRIYFINKECPKCSK